MPAFLSLIPVAHANFGISWRKMAVTSSRYKPSTSSHIALKTTSNVVV
jgi:hypothetical protein